MKKGMKKSAGVTLITLIITVIVILIIVGTAITISLNSGDLFGKTDTTTKKSNIEALKESVSVAVVTSKGYGEGESFKDKLEGQMTDDVVITEVNGKSDVLRVERNGTVVTVFEDGEILDGGMEFWDGSTIECPELKKENDIWNWYIYRPGQLKFLEVFVNNGNSLTAEGGTDLTSYVETAGYNQEDVVMNRLATIYLMNNLDLGARQNNGTLTEGTSWTPIGTNSENVINKLGVFEGNNYCIKGVYVQRNAEYNGLFGNSNTIQNLTIRDSYIEGTNYTGGIVGCVYNGSLTNCHNNNTTVKTDSFGGGIVGVTQNSIINCTNSGSVICKTNSSANFFGGIVGSEYGNANNIAIVSGCINNGTVSGKGTYVGGIAGQIRYSRVSKCVNNGNVKHERSSTGYQQDVGGITGFIINSEKLSECTNNGNVESKGAYVGGIVGRALRTIVIENCYNTGAVTGNSGSGGVLGAAYGDASSIINCYNIGEIEGDSDKGGLIGSNGNSSTCTNSYYLTGTATRDYGNINGSTFVRDKEFIRNDFVITANQNGVIWEVIESKNNGFPVFAQQK